MSPERILWIVLLGVNSLQDMRKREICLKFTLLAAVLGTVWQLVGKNTDPRALASGLIPGLFCLISSLISRGQMGAGDGLVVCTGGICLGF